MIKQNINYTQSEEFSLLSYIGGLFDGEGSFTVSVSYHPHSYVNYQIRPMAIIGMKESDADETLRHICSILKLGKLKTRERKNPKTFRQTEWRIRKFKEVKYFANLILPYLQIKYDTCKNFLHICKLFESGTHFTIDGFLKICKLRDTLNTRTKPINYRDYSWFKHYFDKHPLSLERQKIAAQHRNNTMQTKHKMHNITKQELEYWYLEKNMGTKELGKKFGVSFNTIRYHLIKHGVVRHPVGVNLRWSENK